MKFFLQFIFLFNGACIAVHAIAADIKQSLVMHVQKSIEKAEHGESKLTKDILDLDGYSSAKVRHFLNGLCSLQGGSYLEIGVWKGSTFVSALYGNENNLQQAVAIDNWSQFSGPRQTFLNNTKKFLQKNRFCFYEGDCFKVNFEVFKQPINIYFYDGEHSVTSQKLALVYYEKALDNTFILVVDDYNWIEAQQGTQQGIKDLGFEIVFETVLPARYNGDRENWWNGLYVAVLSKVKKEAFVK